MSKIPLAIALLLACLVAALAYSALAQSAPIVLGYRGLLEDAGTPVNGPRTVIFSVHKDAPTAEPFYCESHEVQVERGRFFVEIGSGEVDPSCTGDLQAAIRAKQLLFLTVEVDDGATRQALDGAHRLTAVPFAHAAIDNSGSVPIGTIIEWLPPEPSAPLPFGFAEADGLVVEDVESPIFRVVLPDLNGRMLRGGEFNQFGGAETHTH
ncbi:MAG: hypothetical protein AAFX94_09965, partial [Myxococcota bacterium]